MRQLASIQRITSLSNIEGADRIVKATVLGWECVVAKSDNFKEGDLVCYFEVDSILPDKPEFEFMRERKFRVKTIKLKGQVSQGLCLPISILPFKGNYGEGDDVTEVLGITKYDPQAVAEQKEFDMRQAITNNRMNKFFGRYKWYRQLFFKPRRMPFPAFIKKTDEDRIQLFPLICEACKGLEFIATEKIDGTSYTAFSIPNPRKWQFWQPYIFGICSRNFHLVRDDGSPYWRITKQLNIEAVLNKIRENFEFAIDNIVLQGEIVGPRVQDNKYKLDALDLYVFNIFIDDIQMDQAQLEFNCLFTGLKPVPEVWKGCLPPTIPAAVEMAKGPSILNPATPREGVVIRNYNRKLSLKIINPDFLIKYNE